MNILSFSTAADGHCGIGDYHGSLTRALVDLGHRVDLVQARRREDRSVPVRDFAKRVAGYDAAIIQHEWGFFHNDTTGISSFRLTADLFNALWAKPFLTFMHTACPYPPHTSRFDFVSTAARIRAARRAMFRAFNDSGNGTVLVHDATAAATFSRAKSLKQIVFPMEPAKKAVAFPREILGGDDVQLLMFGFTNEYKGYETALTAMRVLPDNYHLTIAGGHIAGDRTLDAVYGFLQNGHWPERQTSRVARIDRRYSDRERASLSARVKVVGHVEPEDFAKYMNAADIVLMPYHYSPSGSAALGSVLSYGRPVIASSLPAFTTINDASSGAIEIIAVDAPFQLAETIKRLAADLPARERLFGAALRFANANSFKVLAGRCVDMLGVLSSGRSRAGDAAGKEVDYSGASGLDYGVQRPE